MPPDPLAANRDKAAEKGDEKKEESRDASKRPEAKETGAGKEKQIDQVEQVARAKEAREGFRLPEPSASPAVAAAYQARADR